jgi:hypothetical protein
MGDCPKHFTAGEISAALDLSPQAVRKALKGSEPGSARIVRGVETAAWSVETLPASMREKLNAMARQHRHRSAKALLSNPPERWQPALPIDQVHPDEIDRAKKLREALRRSLMDRNDLTLTTAAFTQRGIDDYRRLHGNTITLKYWRELFDRTIERDRGMEDWNRIEIYLAETPRPKIQPVIEMRENLADDFERIESFIEACRDPSAPNEIERRQIWCITFETCLYLINCGRPERKTIRRARDFLMKRAPSLAKSRGALRFAFWTKFKAYKEAKGDAKAMRDGREENGVRFALPDDDRDRLIHRAVFYYRGDIAPAWRDCLKSGFSLAVIERYAGRAVKKSHVPNSVMDSVRDEVELLTIMYQGRRAFDAVRGYVTRSYDGISSLQCISGDDFTLNSYFYIPDGKGWWQLTRGQVILFIDFRSLRILGWALEPRKSYSSLTIRSLCTHVFAEFGVPEVLYFERGLWKSAALIHGKTDPFRFTEISAGLKEFGVKFIHAIRPRTKVVERIGGIFQDIAEAEPGYCGRDERRDAPESLRRQMAEVEARKVHPSKYFYSLDQWNRRIRQLVEQYNADPQQGHILSGMSPDQAFEAHMYQDNPPMQFGPQLRYLLAHDKRLARVTLNGITIQIGKQKFNYRGEEIAHFTGRDVLAWFDPENPETLTVTDLDRKNAVCVRRSQNPNALESIVEPDSDILSGELSRIHGQASYIRTRYSIVKSKFPLPQRQLLVDAQTVGLGRQIEAQKAELTKRVDHRRRQDERARRLESSTGIFVPQEARDDSSDAEDQFLKKFVKGEIE